MNRAHACLAWTLRLSGGRRLAPDVELAASTAISENSWQEFEAPLIKTFTIASAARGHAVRLRGDARDTCDGAA